MPRNAPSPLRSATAKPMPSSAQRSSMRATIASLSARSSGFGKCRITSGSALSAAKGARSRALPAPQDQPLGLQHRRHPAAGQARPRLGGVERASAPPAAPRPSNLSSGPQERHQRHRQHLAVEVAVEVEEVHLEVRRLRAEGRPHADRGDPAVAAAVRAGQDVDEHRVDPEPRQVQPGEAQVRRREAQAPCRACRRARTAPSIRCQCPRMRAAASGRPSASASRIAVEEKSPLAVRDQRRDRHPEAQPPRPAPSAPPRPRPGPCRSGSRPRRRRGAPRARRRAPRARSASRRRARRAPPPKGSS